MALYRVRVGKFASRTSAQRVVARLEDQLGSEALDDEDALRRAERTPVRAFFTDDRQGVLA